jgi:hypothetical protein
MGDRRRWRASLAIDRRGMLGGPLEKVDGYTSASWLEWTLGKTDSCHISRTYYMYVLEILTSVNGSCPSVPNATFGESFSLNLM